MVNMKETNCLSPSSIVITENHRLGKLKNNRRVVFLFGFVVVMLTVLEHRASPGQHLGLPAAS
jgi:hypothetical protein